MGRLKKCSKCGLKIEIVEENHPLKHICTECGGRGKRIEKDIGLQRKGSRSFK
ncbi:hypothetical protein [Methanobacterium sp. ACI-7]|uniref:hypothetical protein n=1 Tax=unclassified Methanobacterium TaxID=2627676 RepID=UPI0039C100C4